MYKLYFAISLAVGLISTSQAQVSNHFFELTNTFMSKYVDDGKVDYKSIGKNNTDLNKLTNLIQHSKADLNDKNTYTAFWVNAYNILVIHSVIESYPIASPLDIKGFFDTKKHHAGGHHLTLNDIENKMLREKTKDPRLHFVLVCAGNGCPPIINQAYNPSNIESLLKKQTKKALNNTVFTKVNTKKKTVSLSEIFKWYEVDFISNGSLLEFVNIYRDHKIPINYKVKYYPYDWSLNMQ